jgi:hypothetical protein
MREQIAHLLELNKEPGDQPVAAAILGRCVPMHGPRLHDLAVRGSYAVRPPISGKCRACERQPRRGGDIKKYLDLFVELQRMADDSGFCEELVQPIVVLFADLTPEPRTRLIPQPHLVMFEVLSLVVACPGVGLVVSSPVGPVVGGVMVGCRWPRVV